LTKAMKRWRCMVCGYIHSAMEPPEICPVCKAPQSMFVEIDEQGNKITPSIEKQTQQPPTESGPTPEALSTASTDRFADFIKRHHLHPILVHTPNGIIPAIVLFMLLEILFNLRSFELAAYYNLILVLVVMPGVMITGYLEWKKRYNGAKTILFFVKISCSLVVFASILILAGWRFINPEVATPTSPTRWLYFSIGLIMLGAAGVAGHLGGKLVFGSREK
jgi:uncharacterized membrane protein/rubredoxin